jgi:hypothetical protein
MIGEVRLRVAAVAIVAGMLPLVAAAADGVSAGVTRAVTLRQAGATDDHAYCAVLDGEAFADAAPGLRGVRLLRDGVEIPYVVTVSEPQSTQTDAARVLHLREQNGALLFDLAMPQRAYTGIVFKLWMKDFAITAAISAGDVAQAEASRRVGEFALFDLSRERLARQTAVALPEMHDRYLHVTLREQGGRLRAQDLEGVEVPPARAAQSVYSAVTATSEFVRTRAETIAEFDVPAHVPVKRIRFEWDAGAANFMRRVRVEAWPLSDPNDVETISGNISSTQREQQGIALSDTQPTVAMTLGANLQGPAHVRVIVENNGEPALPLRRITLEMREHKLCFDADRGSRLTLGEGGADAVLAPSLAEAIAAQSWEGAGAAVLSGAVARPVKPPQTPDRLLRRLRWWLPVLILLITLLAAWRLARRIH